MKRLALNKIIGVLLVIGVLSYFAGCGGGTNPGAFTKDTSEGTNNSDIILDNGEEDAAVDVEDTTDASRDTGQDMLIDSDIQFIDTRDIPTTNDINNDSEIGETTDVAEEDIVEDESSNCPGGPGCACTRNSDCYSSFCVITRNGKRCAQTCSSDEACPDGYSCVAANMGGDIINICMDKFARLCEPCMKEGDCTIPYFSRKSHCIDFGPEGRFCGGPCTKDEDCPAGYQCKEVTLVNGGQTAKQCVPEQGLCKCTEQAIEDRAFTLCYNENQFGRCKGTRTCTENGLTECTAPEPQKEDCNGVDDDCDGLTDEGLDNAPCERSNDFGVCEGTRSCKDGVWTQCNAPEPEKEICDGKDNNCDGRTDEGFPDEDGDGKADCIDDDSDGDGIPNKIDNCPEVKNPDQKDTDKDGKGDACDKDIDGDGDPNETDCKPLDPTIHHGAPEVCDGKDDNCNGETDEDDAQGCHKVYPDNDGDGYGVTDGMRCMCNPQRPYTATKGGDCDDNNPAVHPDVPEKCDGIDNNCDGMTDENCEPENSWGCFVSGGMTLGSPDSLHGVVSIGIVPVSAPDQQGAFNMVVGVAPITLVNE